jgi:hypothetical protein
MQHFSVFPYQWPKGKEISTVTSISDQFPPHWALPWSHLRPFPIARPALQASTQWISNWSLLGVSRDRTVQEPFSAQVPDSGACQYSLPPLHLDWMPRIRHNFPTASMWWRVHVTLDSVLTVVFVVLSQSFFSFISAPALCYTLRRSLFPSVHYVLIVRFIYFYFPWNCTARFMRLLISVT